MREFKGVKPSLALELTGFAGTPKVFRDRFRSASDGTHQRYSARQIRKIRKILAGIPETPSPCGEFPPIIDVRMTKGGVGKTTVGGNASSAMAMMGHRILMIDGDPQASLTGLFGINWETTPLTHISELMKRVSHGEPSRIEDAVFPIYEDGMLDLIPTDISMANDMWLLSALNRDHAFTRLLEAEKEFFCRYDAIVIDSAPGSSLLATTFMLASKLLLTVVEPQGKALAALGVLASNVREINEAFSRSGVKLDVHIVVNKFNQSKQPHRDALVKLGEDYPGKINDTIIRDSVGFLRETDLDSVEDNGPIIEKEPNSGGARDILDLASSLVKLYGIELGHYDPVIPEAVEAA